MRASVLSSIYLILGCSCLSNALFVLPNTGPKEYPDGERIPMRVNKLTSIHTQFPYDYYSLPFCTPDKTLYFPENLGELLAGDKWENSPYIITVGKENCQQLCKKEHTKEEVDLFISRVKEEYLHNWQLDGLPAATPKILQDSEGKQTEVYIPGFPLGKYPAGEDGREKGPYFLNNHVDITIKYHEDPELYKGKRIIGFEVVPSSKKYDDSGIGSNGAATHCSPSDGRDQLQLAIPDGKSTLTVIYTYQVVWEATSRSWADRWEPYLANTDDQIHWFSIINSMMIVIFLSGMVAMIMMRTLRADLLRYAQADPNEDVEETGWKLVHGDVFRAPHRPMLLSVFVGSGVQVLGTTIITLIFAALGFLSPANHGAFAIAAIVLFVIMGAPAGYTSGRLYKTFNGKSWKKNALMTAMFFPSIVFAIFFVLEMVFVGKHSTGAASFGTFVGLLAMWLGIATPLCFFGSHFAYEKPPIEHPVRTNQISRQIPDQVWYMSPIFSILMGGILPFGAVFIELFFILSAIWGHQFYYIFGFLLIVFFILVITCAEITIVMCYFQLCSEDYHWWWRSYLTAGASAFYMFLYSIFYFFTTLEIHSFASVVLYFGFTMIMTIGFFVLTGTIGFLACYFFVRKIYSQVKVE